MLTKACKARLQHCKESEAAINSASRDELVMLKDRLMADMGMPIGMHTIGVPLIFSVLFMILSFSIPQLSLWSAILAWLSLPPYTLFAYIVPVALVFAGANSIIVFMIARGSMSAVKAHIFLAQVTFLCSVIYFIKSLVGYFNDEPSSGMYLLSALLGMAFISISFRCINSEAFFSMLSYMLHNRAWRKLLKLNRHVISSR
ncbi:hypothetical protein [Brenneria tiliae]|uniref:Uncharacterized protein n=1 Tax=Brenneria tiliae TaxID=2914984 RepID=A0ABT0MVK2_9GAMM|nr:hypothetical protein [Brenneria tiliae]MCL2893880.1 hypothetical protein [Brenneria tiliae]MCL2896399.1 hypothetical protein [Brenneria tiliae]MCL2901072.1 hypothetical protein [Brenneria tiliae]